ncbi:MAG TPA: GDP-mannose 4,6-dehydratase [Gemmataceae bacterium]|nr:GDP-mannose 4,6-dehydratase [Gemmataceae bacterium]
MRILITGVSGFAGGFLAEALLQKSNVQISGIARESRWRRETQHLADRVELHGLDLGDGDKIESFLRQFRPEQIYHLAGYAHVGRSFQEPLVAWNGNLQGTLALYDAVHRWGGKPRILYISSGQIYGEPENPEAAFHERSLLRPTSPYAASKAAADLASYQHARSPGLDIVRVRPFNHIGPRQSPDFAVAHFAKQIADIERNRRPPVLETGNLSPLRDLTDVRDMARAYVMVMEKGRTGEVYNAAAGEVHSMQSVLDRLLGLARVRVEVRQQASHVRATDPSAIRADATKLRQEIGWTPAISLDQTLTDTLEYWRAQP